MAKIKTVSRAVITGYKYDVIVREGNTLTVTGEVTSDTPVRSFKGTQELLKAKGFKGNESLMLTANITKQYEMDEADFIKYAREVKGESNDVNTENKEDVE